MIRSHLKWAVGTLVRLAYGRRAVVRRGPGGVPLHFRPAEYARLLRGVESSLVEHRRAWQPLLRADEVIFDIGANIGLTTQLFFDLLGGRCQVVAFEPIPGNVAFLRRNCAPLGDRVRVVDSAVGDEDGEVTFVENPHHPALSRQRDRVSKSARSALYWSKQVELRVPILRLDTYLDQHPEPVPSFLKIDVEGAGAAVIRGAARLLARARPVISIEFHWPDEQQGVTGPLADLGYRSVSFAHDGRLRIGDPRDCQREGHFVHPHDPRWEALKRRAGS